MWKKLHEGQLGVFLAVCVRVPVVGERGDSTFSRIFSTFSRIFSTISRIFKDCACLWLLLGVFIPCCCTILPLGRGIWSSRSNPYNPHVSPSLATLSLLNICCFNAFSFLSHAEYIQKYATEEALKEQEEGTGDSSSESSMSDFSEDEAQDMEL